MADIVPSLISARNALSRVAIETDSAVTRDRAAALLNKLEPEIQRSADRDGGANEEVVERIEKIVREMVRAQSFGDFEGVVNHGANLIGSLPGDPQSSQKPPWER